MDLETFKILMRKLYTLLILLYTSILSAQNVAVQSFVLDETDVTANLQGSTVLDQNGEKCALIKIYTTATGFAFDVGSLVVQKVEQHTGQIWVYVPHGVKRITMSHSQLGNCEYVFPMPVQRARTYKMELMAGQVQTTVKRAVTSQYVVFKISPAKATIEINDQTLDAVDGGASIRLPFGSYNYTVRAQRYKSTVGKVQVNDPKNKHVVNVSLEPAFSNVTMSVDADAEIWINDQKKGVRTFKGELSYGTYLVECRQEGHQSSQKEITLTKENADQVVTLPVPTPIYGAIDVNSSPIECDVYVDNVKVGTTPMLLEQCLIGNHTIRVAKQGYTEFMNTVTVREGQTENIMARLNSGRQITITSEQGATIFVDGNNVGNSQYTGNLTYGQHTAYAMLNGKRSADRIIRVPQGSGAVPMVQLTFSDNLSFTVADVTFEMIPVDGGTFTMGGTSEQGSDAKSDDKPIHRVRLSSYYIGKTEVTQALWQALMGVNPSYFKSDNLPVETVSWKDCQEFIHKLNSYTGRNFRLPTEAEWEFAARGGKNSLSFKYSGSSSIGDVAWYRENSDRNTHSVGTKQPNELGIYDMSGNVWEWCSDWYGSYDSASLTNPVGPKRGSSRVFRGGCWIDDARYCHVSARYRYSPDFCSRDLGLRLALSK